MCGYAEPADARFEVDRYAAAAVQIDVGGGCLCPLEATLGSDDQERQCFLVALLPVEFGAATCRLVDLRDERPGRNLSELRRWRRDDRRDHHHFLDVAVCIDDVRCLPIVVRLVDEVALQVHDDLSVRPTGNAVLPVAVGRSVGVDGLPCRRLVVGRQLRQHAVEIGFDAGQGLGLGGDAEPADPGLGISGYAATPVQEDVAERRLRDLEPSLGRGRQIRHGLGIAARVVKTSAVLGGGVDVGDELGRWRIARFRRGRGDDRRRLSLLAGGERRGTERDDDEASEGSMDCGHQGLHDSGHVV